MAEGSPATSCRRARYTCTKISTRKLFSRFEGAKNRGDDGGRGGSLPPEDGFVPDPRLAGAVRPEWHAKSLDRLLVAVRDIQPDPAGAHPPRAFNCLSFLISWATTRPYQLHHLLPEFGRIRGMGFRHGWTPSFLSSRNEVSTKSGQLQSWFLRLTAIHGEE